MGEIAEDIINGFTCQACGAVIDEKETGHPRNCSACSTEDFEINTDSLEELIKRAGFIITQKKKLQHCVQLRLSNGSIVMFYTSGKVVLQGKPNKGLKQLFNK